MQLKQIKRGSMLSEFCDHKKVDLMHATLKNNFSMTKVGLE